MDGKLKNTLNVISLLQFEIDYHELWHTTSLWSTKTKYCIFFYTTHSFSGDFLQKIS